MNVFGIIAEFNPFHNGHQYLFDTIRAKYHADYLAVVMSGNYVQRGEPAVIDKFSRTQMALQSGADLVLELPLPYAVSSAEMFALGGVTALDALNCVTHLAFGCEADVPEADAFFSIADYLLNEPPAFSSEIKRRLNLGHSYPAARKGALETSGRFSAAELKLLDYPNNTLGIEYAKGILLADSPFPTVAISRSGSGHHETATAIRELLTVKKPDFANLEAWMPRHCISILQKEFETHAPVTADDYSAYLYYALSSRPMSYYADKGIISRDEAARISRMLSGYAGYTSFCQLVKSKQYTYTRLSRAMLRIMFGLPQLRLDAQNRPSSQKRLPSIPYLRLLGMKKEASHLLRKASVPILSKPAHAKNKGFGSAAAELFRTELFANSLYYQIPAMKYQAQPLHEMECSPIIC